MKVQKNWSCLYEAISAMEEVSSCLVLRNYEDMSNDNYYMIGHDDIDFLCDNQKAVVKKLDARKNVYWGSKDHFIVKINGKDIKFGLRYVGDGYYDAKWQREMLDNKVRYHDSFYVMEKEDYFYSLLFHALLQKQKMAEDYQIRLKNMGQNLGVEFTDDEYLSSLLNYLKKNKYKIEYPSDVTVPINYNNIPENLLGKKIKWKIKKLFFKPRWKLHNFSNKLKGKVSNG